MTTTILRQILTTTQYKYYTEYFDNGKTLGEISIIYDVDITTVCRVIKAARRRIISFNMDHPEIE